MRTEMKSWIRIRIENPDYIIKRYLFDVILPVRNFKLGIMYITYKKNKGSIMNRSVGY
jgi:hypothetical protein